MDPGGETDVQAQVRRARLCLGDELGREVETIHSVASFCQRERDSSIPASDVEDTGLFREHCLERLDDLQIPVGLSSRCELVGSKGCVKPAAQPFGTRTFARLLRYIVAAEASFAVACRIFV
jgi:hypothetical protein